MKRILLYLFVCALMPLTSNAQSVSFDVTTSTNGGMFTPDHVIAIWVTDASDTFVKTLKVSADDQKLHLVDWNASSSSNVTDAITGATINSHETHSVTWDCTDVGGNEVADGDYKIVVEFSEDNTAYGGPGGETITVSFTKGASQQAVTPADETYFTGVSLTFTPSENNIDNNNSSNEIKLLANPVAENIELNFGNVSVENATVEVLDLSGKSIIQNSFTSVLGDVSMDISMLNAGMYLLNVKTVSRDFSTKIIVK